LMLIGHNELRPYRFASFFPSKDGDPRYAAPTYF
jgi:hypothetical protein